MFVTDSDRFTEEQLKEHLFAFLEIRMYLDSRIDLVEKELTKLKSENERKWISNKTKSMLK